jgi:glyoxylase-like metal-dependent hydrolase (beta-lactamase superfamily II)
MNIYALSLPNPYFEKDNNVYLLDAGDGGLALIDTGVDLPNAFQTLIGELKRLGYAPERIQKIFLTHKHLDHFGVAHRLRALSGATVYVHELDHPDVIGFDERYPKIHEQYLERMQRWGVPLALIESMATTRRTFLQLGRSVPAEPLRDGQEIPLGDATLRVLHTPGHTLGSACFLLDDALFVGDHILPDYTPNIGATDIMARHALMQYRRSLEKLKELDGMRVFPGHGREILSLKARIDEILGHHEEREAKILKILKDGQPRTVFEIAEELFGSLRDHHALLGSGEVYAHLEVLEAQGEVKELEDGRYAAV